MKKFLDVDEYISSFPEKTQILLHKVRDTIMKTAPGAEEVISHGMPGYKLNGMLVWFAGYAKHIGFYPRPSALTAFKKEISIYKNAKGSVQFPLDKPIPFALIKKMVQFRVKENLEKVKR